MSNLSRKISLLGTIGILGLGGCDTKDRESKNSFLVDTLSLHGRIESVNYIDISKKDSLYTFVRIRIGNIMGTTSSKMQYEVVDTSAHEFKLNSGNIFPNLQKDAQVSFLLTQGKYDINKGRLSFTNRWDTPATLIAYTPAETIRFWDAQRAAERNRR